MQPGRRTDDDDVDVGHCEQLVELHDTPRYPIAVGDGVQALRMGVACGDERQAIGPLVEPAGDMPVGDPAASDEADVQAHQSSPAKFGGRFSTNAAIPSSRSAVWWLRSTYMRSNAIPFSTEAPTAVWMQALVARTANGARL